jgi:hypothetical protein
MRLAAKSLFLLVSVVTIASKAQAQFPKIEHVIVIIQENRTPDNLFQGLCAPPWGTAGSCGTGANQYNIQSTYLDSKGVPQPLQSVGLAANFDLDHSHGGPHRDGKISGWDFENYNPGVPVPGMCGKPPSGFVLGCAPDDAQFKYVFNTPVTNTDGSTGGLLDPYLNMATNYGWANFMYQTNQGPSYPAHQFLFSGTSADTASDDALGIFVAENGTFTDVGCAALPAERVQLVKPNPNPPPFGIEPSTAKVFPCFLPQSQGGHNSMKDLLEANTISWKYYAQTQIQPNKSGFNIAGGIWTAPNSFSNICTPANHQCTGTEWTTHVDLSPADVLTDVAACKLQQVSWVTPDGSYSDHPYNSGWGPAWVAAVVNAVGQSTCTNPDNTTYWDSTAIFITWDDWGGWFDHVPPNISNGAPFNDYTYGFRVPLIVVSAFTPQKHINNFNHDFGSILRAIEGIFLGTANEGALGFADRRSTNDLHDFFGGAPRVFTPIPAPLGASFFEGLRGTRPPEPPDND